jgi:hypothetical protein
MIHGSDWVLSGDLSAAATKSPSILLWVARVPERLA